MRAKTILKAGLSMFFLLFVFFISCEEEETEPTKTTCNYTTFNPASADYTCADSGYVQVGNMKCCPGNAPYHCPSKGKCYTSCSAASDAGCSSIVYGGTGGGGGSSGSCDDPYNGPTGDIQSDSFCQAAYHYQCQGNSAQVTANCKIYNQMRADNPGMPKCPYCN